MKSSKMYLLISMLLVLSTVLFGCNNEGNESASAGGGEEWPTEPITIVVPTGEGGSNDRQARAIAPYLQKHLGVPVSVENREGGSTIVGTMSYLQEENDGSYLFYPLQYHFSGGIVRGGDYSTDDFSVVGVTHEAPIAVWVNANSPYQTAEDLIEAIQNNPGEISVGYQPGSASHIAAMVLKESIGDVPLKEVPYDGGGDQRAALLGEHIDFMTSDFEGTATAVGDEARALLLFAQEPHVMNESLPLAKDVLSQYSGDFTSVVQNFRLLTAHQSFKEEYPERFDKLREALEKTYEDPEFQEWVEGSDMFMNLLDVETSENMFKEADETIKQYESMFQE